jgi:type IV secretion system protein VirB10
MMMHRLTFTAFLLAGSLAATAQTTAQPSPGSAPSAPAQNQAAPDSTAPAAPAPAAAPAPRIFIVPAGTKVLLELKSSINTKSAKPGDGIYLASTFPVVVGNRVLIPSGVYVQGVIDSVERPGREKNAQLNMHFTSMIFPNGSVVEIPGMVNSLPGSQNQKVNGQEGTIEQQGGSNKAHNAGEVAKVAVPTGATIGSIGGLEAGHPLAGGLEGAAAGLAAAGIVALFTHRADINIPSGSQVEMVIQRPLELEENNLNGPSTLVPSSAQQQPMAKPTLRDRPAMVCPTGSLGCSQY